MLTLSILLETMGSAVLIILRNDRCSMELIVFAPFIEFFRRILLRSLATKHESD